MGVGSSRPEEAQEAGDLVTWGPEEAAVVFTAYFEGTANVVERRTTQIGLFHELDRGVDVGLSPAAAGAVALAARAEPAKRGPLRFKMALNGCGHEHGLAGVVFAYGMRAQCECVADCVRAVRAELGEPTTQLNVVGLSRGAVAALAVAEILGAEPERFVGGEALAVQEAEAARLAAEAGARARAAERAEAAWAKEPLDGDVALDGDASPASERGIATLIEQAVAYLPNLPRRDGDEHAGAGAAARDGGAAAAPARSDSFGDAGAEEKAGPEATREPPPPPPPPPPPTVTALAKRRAARGLARRTMRLHLLLFDPVPGNQIFTTQYIDPFGYSTGNQAMDVTRCEGVLRRVLAIYPYEPLPAITFHAPLVPEYPASGCHVDEVASLGCHQGAILCAPNRISCRLSYAMVRSFLANECAVRLRGCRPFDESLATRQATLRVLEMLRAAAVDDAAKHGAAPNSRFVVRMAHAKSTSAAVIRHANGKYLNAFHHRLAHRAKAENGDAAVEAPDDDGGDDDATPLYILDVVR